MAKIFLTLAFCSVMLSACSPHSSPPSSVIHFESPKSNMKMIQWHENGDYSRPLIQRYVETDEELNQIIIELESQEILYLANFLAENDSYTGPTKTVARRNDNSIGTTHRGSAYVEISEGVGVTSSGKIAVSGFELP